MYLNGQTFSSVFEQFSFLSKIFGVKMQKSTFLRENGFGSSLFFFFFFIKLTFRWLQTGMSDLKKRQTIEILLIVDFLRIFKCCIFQIFRDF